MFCCLLRRENYDLIIGDCLFDSMRSWGDHEILILEQFVIVIGSSKSIFVRHPWILVTLFQLEQRRIYNLK